MPNWNLLTSGTPTARFSAVGVYDPGEELGTVVGGNTNESGETILNETWLFDGQQWAEQTSGVAAPYVRSCGLAYGVGSNVGSENRIVLYGGFGSPDGIEANAVRNWVYQYDSRDWGTALIGAGAPPTAGAYPAFAYYPERTAYLMQGGLATYAINQAYELELNDAETFTWVYKTVGNPGTNCAGSLTYDQAQGDLILFGGWKYSVAVDQLKNFTYKYDSDGNWSNLNPSVLPPARAFHNSYFDTSLNSVVIFGGMIQRTPPIWTNDSWYLDRAQNKWIELQPLVTPAVRGNGAMFYQPNLKQTVYFGGQGSLFSETWGFITGGIDANQFNFSTENVELDPQTADRQAVGLFVGA